MEIKSASQTNPTSQFPQRANPKGVGSDTSRLFVASMLSYLFLFWSRQVSLECSAFGRQIRLLGEGSLAIPNHCFCSRSSWIWSIELASCEPGDPVHPMQFLLWKREYLQLHGWN